MKYETEKRAEVEWYRKNGKYPDRIARDLDGSEYVIGDYAWGESNPERAEKIEHLMSACKPPGPAIGQGGMMPPNYGGG